MAKWFNILSNSKKVMEKVNNGNGDSWDRAMDEVVTEMACTDTKAWKLNILEAEKRFNKECYDNGEW